MEVYLLEERLVPEKRKKNKEREESVGKKRSRGYKLNLYV
jgi:hypothetical protein